MSTIDYLPGPDASVDERVAAGTRWLDEHGPEDWRWRISLPDFHIENACRCVLGQVFNDEEILTPGYWRVVRPTHTDQRHEDRVSVTLSREEAMRLGFDAKYNHEDEVETWTQDELIEHTSDYDALQEAWLEVLS